MTTKYYVDLHIQTREGFATYGRFDLGHDREKAEAIFRQLKGTNNISDESILHMDFTEMVNGIPLPISVLHCTIDDIAINSRIITRDVFRDLALEND